VTALLRATPTLRLEGMAVGAVGTSSLLSDSWRSAGPDPVRTADRVHHFAFRSRLASEARLGRGSTLTVTLGWSRGGGSDPSSRELLPVEEALQLDAWLLWRASRVDVLEVRLAMTDTTLDIGSRATMATLAGRWRRQVTESLAAWAAAGSGLVVSEGLSDTEPTRGTLLLEAGAEHALPVHGYLQRLEIRAAPGIDRLLGTVDPRLEGEYVGTFGRLPAWRLEGRIVAAMTRRTPGTDHLALLEVRLLRGLTRSLTVRGGVQGSRQRSTDPALPALVEWIALAGIEWWPTGRPESAYGPIGARPGGGPWW
jgi:hypothetical protein